VTTAVIVVEIGYSFADATWMEPPGELTRRRPPCKRQVAEWTMGFEVGAVGLP